MTKKLNLASIFIFTLLISTSAQAQNLAASLPDLEGRAGEQVIVDLELAGNTLAAQAGINMIYNPDVITIEDVSIDVNPGPVINENLHFVIRGIKDTSVQDPTNSEGLFFAVFPASFPLNVIQNGPIGRIIFRINQNAEPGEFSDIIFSFLDSVPANTTSFASQNGSIVSIDQADFINGRITVIRGGGGGSGSCALASAQTSMSDAGALLTPFLLLPLLLLGRRLGTRVSP